LLSVFSSCRQTKIQFVYSINQDNLALECDSVLLSYTNKYTDSLNQLLNQIIANTDTSWLAARPQSILTHWCADAALAQGIALMPADSEKLPICGLLNNGGLRGSLPNDTIKLHHFYELMPFENKLCAIKLSPEKMRDLIGYIINKRGEPIAGMMLRHQNIADGAYAVKISDKIYNFDKPVWVITSDYLANGGDNMTFFSNPIERINFNITLREIFILYAKKQQLLNVNLNERYIYVKP